MLGSLEGFLASGSDDGRCGSSHGSMSNAEFPDHCKDSIIQGWLMSKSIAWASRWHEEHSTPCGWKYMVGSAWAALKGSAFKRTITKASERNGYPECGQRVTVPGMSSTL